MMRRAAQLAWIATAGLGCNSLLDYESEYSLDPDASTGTDVSVEGSAGNAGQGGVDGGDGGTAGSGGVAGSGGIAGGGGTAGAGGSSQPGACGNGAVSTPCTCGGAIVDSGFCCGGVARTTDCMRVRLDGGLASGTITFFGKLFSPLVPYLTAGTAYDSTEGITGNYPIANTDYDALYQNETWVDTPAPAVFTIPVDNGNYTVHLHFVDWVFTTPGKRLFHVDLQGGRVLTDLDIVSEAGPSSALLKSFDVAVTDAAIHLTLTNHVSNAEIAAVEILPQGEAHLPTLTTSNYAPTVDAGADQTLLLPATSVTLTGTAADKDGDTLSYAWMKTAGGGANIVSPTALSTQVTGLSAGSYTFTLTVKDGKGGTTSDAVAVTVKVGGDGCCGTIGPTITSFTDSGPITLTSGQTVTGLRITNPSGPCIFGSNVTNVHISNNWIGPCGDTAAGSGVELDKGSAATVDHNHFEDVASAFHVLGTGAGDSNIVFENNYATMVRGPAPNGKVILFDNVTGAGNRIECNVSDQAIGSYGTGPEEHINIFRSSGSVASPFLIRHNRLRGGGSTCAGGIETGSVGSAYTTIESNILVNPGIFGIAVTGGQNIRVLTNDVFAQQTTWTNIGSYVGLENAGVCSNHEVRGNRINFTNSKGEQNSFWNAGNCGTIVGEADNSFGDSSITAAIWSAPFADCP